jgi:hypothetical protein
LKTGYEPHVTQTKWSNQLIASLSKAIIRSAERSVEGSAERTQPLGAKTPAFSATS